MEYSGMLLKNEPENKQIDQNKVVGLIWNDEAHWRLKNDKTRVILYETRDEDVIMNSTSVIPPTDAILLSLLDGKRTLGELISLCANLFDQPVAAAETAVCQFLEKYAMSLEEKSPGSYTPAYAPDKLVIPSWEVDIVSTRFNSPLTIQFRVTDACMRKCRYCNVDVQDINCMTQIPLERFDTLAEELKEMEVFSVILSGGDPFVHKDIDKIIACFTRREIYPYVSTKSFVNEEMAAKLVAAGLRSIQVSVDAPLAEAADFLANSPGAFNHAIQAIKNLRNAGLRVVSNTVVSSYNILMMPQLVRTLSDLGVTQVKFAQYSRSHYRHDDEALFVSRSAGEWLEEQIKKLNTDKSLHVAPLRYSYQPDFNGIHHELKKQMFISRSMCTGARWGLVIAGNGKAIPCDEIPATEENSLGDVMTQSLMDIWNSGKHKQYVEPDRELFIGQACYTCEEFEDCHRLKGRCFRDSLKAYGNLFAPSPMCWRAPRSGKRLC